MESGPIYQARLVSHRRARIPSMDTTALIGLFAAIAGVGGFGLAWLWNRTRPSGDEKRVAELEAQLVAANQQALRSGVQAAAMEREAETLRVQLLESVQRGAAFE